MQVQKRLWQSGRLLRQSVVDLLLQVGPASELSPRVWARAEATPPNQDHASQGPNVPSRSRLGAPLAGCPEAQRREGVLLGPALARGPEKTHLWAQGRILHQEALGREVAVGQVLLVQVQQGLEGLAENSVATLWREGQSAQAAGVRQTLHHREAPAICTVAEDRVEVRVAHAELPEEGRCHLELCDHLRLLLRIGDLADFRLRGRSHTVCTFDDCLPCSNLLMVGPGTQLLGVLPPSAVLLHLAPLCVHVDLVPNSTLELLVVCLLDLVHPHQRGVGVGRADGADGAHARKGRDLVAQGRGRAVQGEAWGAGAARLRGRADRRRQEGRRRRRAQGRERASELRGRRRDLRRSGQRERIGGHRPGSRPATARRRWRRVGQHRRGVLRCSRVGQRRRGVRRAKARDGHRQGERGAPPRPRAQLLCRVMRGRGGGERRDVAGLGTAEGDVAQRRLLVDAPEPQARRSRVEMAEDVVACIQRVDELGGALLGILRQPPHSELGGLAAGSRRQHQRLLHAQEPRQVIADVAHVEGDQPLRRWRLAGPLPAPRRCRRGRGRNALGRGLGGGDGGLEEGEELAGTLVGEGLRGPQVLEESLARQGNGDR
mmetsp:Transcript_69526/g.226465  ORF Transcript_69526/g.226465 Transcript_69526/m.226465 type:complete len:603 (+) Transcript_69526:257-2065(+)